MAQPLGTVLYPCESLNVLARKVVVLGQGPLGLGFTQILAGMMPSELVAVDLLDYRLDFARQLGASVCVNPGRESVKQTVDELTGGVGADVVVDTAGSSETINLALDLVRFRGMVSCFGQPLTQPIPFNYHSFSRKEVRLLPTITHARPDVAQGVVEAVDLMAKGRLDVGWMVTHRFPFAETGKAFETYANKEANSLKVVIELW